MENCSDHGPGRELAARRSAERRADAEIQVSPRNMAHFPGCMHKDDPDFDEWAPSATSRTHGPGVSALFRLARCREGGS